MLFCSKKVRVVLHNYFHLAVSVTCYRTNTNELHVLLLFAILFKMFCWFIYVIQQDTQYLMINFSHNIQ